MQFWIIQYLWGCETEEWTWETNFEQLREIKIVYIPISSNIFPENYFMEGNSCTETLKSICTHFALCMLIAGTFLSIARWIDK